MPSAANAETDAGITVEDTGLILISGANLLALLTILPSGYRI